MFVAPFHHSNLWRNVPEDLRSCCNWENAEEAFYVPPLSKLLEFPVLVCTCYMGGRLHNFGVSLGSYDMVVIDEAGNAVEPGMASSSFMNL